MSKKFVGNLGIDDSGLTIKGLLTDEDTKTVENVNGEFNLLTGTITVDITPKPEEQK